ncbi:DUF550 domain-containing protein [Corticibacter populi]|uniref:DUF550 domain-containing protein n=2 Tax=Corticibacter populi TaxID=1550736 RepID=A0A3M6R0X6_9BURK|nr:DUF550 domain-containing protein [Corticibacter populi]
MIDVLLQETRRLHRELIDAQGREAEPRPFDFAAHLARQAEFSARTFGPGQRTQGVCDHIRKELREIEAAPDDLSEWIDVAILALDGAWRIGATPTEIIAAMVAKQTKNEGRRWPDWHTADPSKAIEHDRGDEHLPSAQADADKRDAQRYRWLRDGTIDEDGNINDEIHVAVDSPEWPNQWALVAQDLDAAIDAALKKGGAA